MWFCGGLWRGEAAIKQGRAICKPPLLRATRDERDVGSRGGVDDGVFVEEKSAPGFDGDNAKVRFGGDFNGGDADDGHIETHVLIWLGDFDHDGIFAAEQAPALDGFV